MKKILFLASALVMLSSNAFAIDKTPAVTALSKPNTSSVSSPVALQPQSIDNLVGTFNNPIKVFFSDIDGTLIPLDKSAPRGTIPPSIVEGANKLHDANIPLILITGRSSKEARVIAQKIGIENQYVIGQQGAEIVNPQGEMIYEDGIPSCAVKKIIADVKSFNKKNGDSVVPFIYVKGTMYTFKDIDLPYILDKPVKVHCVSCIGKDFTSIKVGLYSADPIKLRAVQQYLAPKYDQFNVVISADCYCDVSSKTATKGHAIKILTEKLGVDLKNVATIGDTENDISMLKLLKDNGGLPIAVGNANAKTRENANYVSSTVNEGGFLKAVKNVLKNNAGLRTK